MAVAEGSAERVRALTRWESGVHLDLTHVESPLLWGKAPHPSLLCKQTTTSPALSSLLAPPTQTPSLSYAPFLHCLFISD